MKLIAFLLPQFHPIAENNRWWGEGFTEWTNVRKAVPLYQGHLQPKLPMDNNYYNLTEAAAREWQARTAEAYGIYGFCYYHYWFKGKRLLEKPIQAVLESKAPDFPFCLSWANEPWTRKWDGNDQDVLMPQSYGDEADWSHHFYNLLEAFQDKRYIRIDGKPLFIIYRPSSIPRCDEMLMHWKRLAQRNGLEGLHLVQTLGGFPVQTVKGFDASVEFEPHYTFAHGNLHQIWSRIEVNGKEHLVVDYDKVWNSILERTPHRNGEPIYPGAYVNWDNTPRRGVDGQSCLGMTPQKFSHYLSRQLLRAKTAYGSDYVFINAWNEWAEGAYLEPDNQYNYQYLQAVKYALHQYEHSHLLN
ncbi:lipopolysaccharide biosynthesis protein [Paenibacillus shirakamiensis]|uniref:Lipopolysaccharide biosynthesis protein n=1 Tax=Paenibacillus shirakamiensis TaxID=1265935 RepID=A0ABS4JJY5_9BACL|nr:glycoside hydrolase family 99-like domain-containing protein [Paenibacillus shirakamiensis]MBP2002010.1 lipopolysaccharide biosynthesis protein [Paenibacillus shirakamiensis]